MIKMFDSECNFDIYGNVAGENNQIPAVQDQDQELADLLRKNKKFCHTPRTNWPVHEIKPVSEFSNTKIFCMEFPWLFPTYFIIKMVDLQRTSCGVFSH